MTKTEMQVWMMTATTEELLALNKQICAVIKGRQRQRSIQAGSARYVGEIVTFMNSKRGVMMKGKVLKVNVKTVKVDCDVYGLWTVSPGLLKAVA